MFTCCQGFPAVQYESPESQGSSSSSSVTTNVFFSSAFPNAVPSTYNSNMDNAMAGDGEKDKIGEASESSQNGGNASETTQQRRRIVRFVFSRLIGKLKWLRVLINHSQAEEKLAA